MIWVWTSEGRLIPINPRYGRAGKSVSFGRSAGPSAGIASGGGFLWLTLPPATVIRVNPAKPERARVNQPDDGVQGAVAYSKGSAWVGGLDRVFPIEAADPDVVGAAIVVGRVHSMTFSAGSLWVVSGGHWDQGIPIALRRVKVDGGEIDQIDAGGDPVAVASGGGSIWVGSGTDRTIRRIDPATNFPVATTPLGAPATALAGDPEGVWVAVGDRAIGRTSLRNRS
jgi:streptogramin lyase